MQPLIQPRALPHQLSVITQLIHRRTGGRQSVTDVFCATKNELPGDQGRWWSGRLSMKGPWKDGYGKARCEGNRWIAGKGYEIEAGNKENVWSVWERDTNLSPSFAKRVLKEPLWVLLLNKGFDERRRSVLIWIRNLCLRAPFLSRLPSTTPLWFKAVFGFSSASQVITFQHVAPFRGGIN